ncbi:MAG: hypothetical protein PHU71_03250 [Candidatus Gracilibacteria bacterium]|nr:hypothetical protein [Candidatus Gracilibacteria bacterium]
MKAALKKGLGFGLTSGVITTLGLIVGLHSGTHSELVVIGGILTIAVADAMSDALGVHISEEYENKKTHREVWYSTFATFIVKFLVALTFVVPVLLVRLDLAIWISIIWGLSLIGILSFFMAKNQKEAVWRVAGEHLLIACLVIFITHYLGEWIGITFGA